MITKNLGKDLNELIKSHFSGDIYKHQFYTHKALKEDFQIYGLERSLDQKTYNLRLHNLTKRKNQTLGIEHLALLERKIE